VELPQGTLPDLNEWNEAVTRVEQLFGHAVLKHLNASNLAAFAEKAKGSLTDFKADCDSLPDRIQLVIKNTGVPESDFVKAGGRG